MPANRIWVNVPKGGDTVFVTMNTVVAASVFAKPAARDLMVATLVDVCSMSESKLHAFAVMPQIVHFIAETALHWELPDLVKRIKQNSAKQIGPVLPEDVQKMLVEQCAEAEHLFWTRSYRSILMRTPKTLDERIEYIHQNPVLTELADDPADYRWSSALAYRNGKVDGDGCLDLDYLYETFGP